MYHFYRTPRIYSLLFSNLHWRFPAADKEIFLTFDDGPIPNLTEYVIDQLKKYGAKATFFCVGDNIRKNPQVVKTIINEGHGIGNHTYNHLKAWKTNHKIYLENISKCQEYINKLAGLQITPFFRPPYGQITPKLIWDLKKQYQIIMWDVLTYDFKDQHSSAKSLSRIISATRPGSIVVFHDNLKAEEKLKYMLPRFLNYYIDLGYTFKRLPTA